MGECVNLHLGDVLREGDKKQNNAGEWEDVRADQFGKMINSCAIDGFTGYRRPYESQSEQQQPQQQQETELERKAWEFFLHCKPIMTSTSFEAAQAWLKERNKRRAEQ